jgi:hypothetical protein
MGTHRKLSPALADDTTALVYTQQVPIENLSRGFQFEANKPPNALRIREPKGVAIIYRKTIVTPSLFTVRKVPEGQVVSIISSAHISRFQLT